MQHCVGVGEQTDLGALVSPGMGLQIQFTPDHQGQGPGTLVSRAQGKPATGFRGA